MRLDFETDSSLTPLASNNQTSHANNFDAKVRSLGAGIKAAQEGRRFEARQLLLHVTEIDSQNETAWMWLASVSDYPEELIVFLQKVLEINPENERAAEWMKATRSLLSRTFVARGVEAVHQEQRDTARQCFREAAEHDSSSEAAWLWLASVTDKADEKIALLEKALTINPDNEAAVDALKGANIEFSKTLLRTANLEMDAGNRDKASEIVSMVLDRTPECTDAWTLHAYLSEDIEVKLSSFEQAVQLDPENEAARVGLGAVQSMIGQRAAEAASGEELNIHDTIVCNAGLSPAPDEDCILEDWQVNDSAAPSAVESERTMLLSTDPTDELDMSVLTSARHSLTYEAAMPEAVAEKANEFDYNHLPAVAAPAEREEYWAESGHISHESHAADSQQQGTYGINDSFRVVAAEETQTYGEAKFDEIDLLSGESSFEDFVDDASTDAAKSSEFSICPFCAGANEARAVVCSSCCAVLTLSDLEMLLAHTGAAEDILKSAIEKAEADQEARASNPAELVNLGIAHLNSKNFRKGLRCLLEALRLNPNDVVLGSQVNALTIRLAEIEDQAEKTNEKKQRQLTILVVDDSATVRKLISGKLEKSGHTVIAAVDGIDALGKLEDFVPDLVLLDINMPRMDGYQTCKQIRVNQATKDVPVVMISGKDGFFDKVRGRMSGTTGYITKPFGPETLMRTVEAYVS
jgi:CheY-like chemotaxis protein